MLAVLFLFGMAVLAGGYLVYGRILDRKLEVTGEHPVPSETMCDGVDYVPARTPVLFGHHFSSIAGAGPIVGPVIAAMAFGWLPAFAWILLGTILIGGVHDYASLVASIRSRGRSIAEVARWIISPAAQKILLAFIWLALVYVLVVFLDLTATTFKASGEVATSSILFIALAILFGLGIYRLRLPVWLGSLIFVPLVFAGIFVGRALPLPPTSLPAIAGDPGKSWALILVVYCYVASVTPVWVLLQPRDYLASFLLYATVLASAVGLLFGGFAISFPPFLSFQSNIGPLFPILFVTIACGAISGFHSVIAAGTTAKQLAREQDAKLVGYGAMATEGVVSLIALATVIMLTAGSDAVAAYRANELSAIGVFARGMGRFTEVFGIPAEIGRTFGALAISTFLLTTLDTCTRLGRFLFHEFFGIEQVRGRFLSTLATLALPALFVLLTFRDAAGHIVPAWKAIWPVFGATNQLLAALALLVVTLWLRAKGKRALFVAIPAAFMLIITLSSLVYIVAGGGQNRPVEVIAVALFVLAIVVVAMSLRAARRDLARSGRVLDDAECS
ncbi:MAG: carbon starvation protein A [Candidatus Eisenbacteria bacterium]|nr:carbon starvation protein A [Candidatus Eisenbacteria bacterium]